MLGPEAGFAVTAKHCETRRGGFEPIQVARAERGGLVRPNNLHGARQRTCRNHGPAKPDFYVACQNGSVSPELQSFMSVQYVDAWLVHRQRQRPKASPRLAFPDRLRIGSPIGGSVRRRAGRWTARSKQYDAAPALHRLSRRGNGGHSPTHNNHGVGR